MYPQRLTITCVKDELGKTTHYVGDGHDITEEKQAEADRQSIAVARRYSRIYFLPMTHVPGFDIAGAVHPADRVSGDYFDFLALGQKSIGVLVADVCGHGLGAALLMAQTQAYLRAWPNLSRILGNCSPTPIGSSRWAIRALCDAVPGPPGCRVRLICLRQLPVIGVSHHLRAP